jgi:RNA polymerase sigma factor (TIGR02999 family)
MDSKGEITALLGQLSRGEQDAMHRLLPLVYDELHRIARSYFRRERGDHTLQPTALVHEAYIRLIGQHATLESRSHFLALAATQMRRILVDHARKHAAGRRGGGGEKVLLDTGIAAPGDRPLDIIALDSALVKLGELDPKLARLVELRFFGGLSVEDTAEIMGVSTATVKRSWNSARAFLHRAIAGESAASASSGS